MQRIMCNIVILSCWDLLPYVHLQRVGRIQRDVPTPELAALFCFVWRYLQLLGVVSLFVLKLEIIISSSNIPSCCIVVCCLCLLKWKVFLYFIVSLFLS